MITEAEIIKKIQQPVSQNQAVLRHLNNHGTITPIEALNLYGIFRLGARIHDLRQKGHNINTVLVGEKFQNQYAKYVYQGNY